MNAEINSLTKRENELFNSDIPKSIGRFKKRAAQEISFSSSNLQSNSYNVEQIFFKEEEGVEEQENVERNIEEEQKQKSSANASHSLSISNDAHDQANKLIKRKKASSVSFNETTNIEIKTSSVDIIKGQIK
jgi:hypothetical protein